MRRASLPSSSLLPPRLTKLASFVHIVIASSFADHLSVTDILTYQTMTEAKPRETRPFLLFRKLYLLARPFPWVDRLCRHERRRLE